LPLGHSAQLLIVEQRCAPRLHYVTLHYKLFIVAKVKKKTARSTMAQVTQQCQDMRCCEVNCCYTDRSWQCDSVADISGRLQLVSRRSHTDHRRLRRELEVSKARSTCTLESHALMSTVCSELMMKSSQDAR